jgi:hypothetical protein
VEPAELLAQVGRLISDRRRPKASSRGKPLRSAPKPSHSPKQRSPSPDPAAQGKRAVRSRRGPR